MVEKNFENKTQENMSKNRFGKPGWEIGRSEDIFWDYIHVGNSLVLKLQMFFNFQRALIKKL